ATSRTSSPSLHDALPISGALSDELGEFLRAAIEEFRSTFQLSGDRGPLKEAEAKPLTEEQQEALKRFRRPTEEEFRKKAGPAGEDRKSTRLNSSHQIISY